LTVPCSRDRGPSPRRGGRTYPDTALPGEPGNIAIAGHRDGFFRSLKDVRAGDVIELSDAGRPSAYVVEGTWIVQPDDVSVLDPTTAPSITLVTCYPFYFVGSAPQRFIVRATRSIEASRRRRVESPETLDQRRNA
jgi:sortase A